MTPELTNAPPARRSQWQFSLRLILLLMAAVGVWTAEIANRRAMGPLQQRIKAMRPLARELTITDPEKIAVVKCEELWYDDNEWEIYLPDGEYRLALATREVGQQDVVLPPYQSAPLPAGKFRLSLLQEKTATGWRVDVLKDGALLLTAEEPAEWYPAHGSSGGGQFSLAEQLPPNFPVVLFRRRFSRPVSATTSQTPAGPCEGVLLWIEPVPLDEQHP